MSANNSTSESLTAKFITESGLDTWQHAATVWFAHVSQKSASHMALHGCKQPYLRLWCFGTLISKTLPASANVIGVASTCMACSRETSPPSAPHDRIITTLGHRCSQAITRTSLAHWGGGHDPFLLGDL